MLARPNSPWTPMLNSWCVTLATVMFSVTAVAGLAVGPPPPAGQTGEEEEKASDDKKSSSVKKPSDDRKDSKEGAEKKDDRQGRRKSIQRAGKKPASGDKPDDAKKDEAGQAEGDESADKEVDPALRRKVDDLMEKSKSEGRGGAGRGQPSPSRDRRRGTERKEDSAGESEESETPSPSRRPRPGRKSDESAGSGAGPAGPETTLDIPPQETAVPPEERTYTISIKDSTYEILMEGIGRETGLGVIGQAPKGGKVSFVTEEELTFDELMERVQMLLTKYKAHDPYTLIRQETHLQVVRVADYYRDLPRERMYSNVEEYRAANLTDYDLALVLYTPKIGSIADLSVLRDFMPDYVRITPLEDRNALTIFAFVKDIEKYLDLIPIFVGTWEDPRTLEIIPVEHIGATEAVDKLRELMDLQADGSSKRRRTPTSKVRSSQASPLAGAKEPDVSVVPDDLRGVLVVRAMQDKIEEIKSLLPFIDVGLEIEYEPVVIKVTHADPVDLIATIQQVLDVAGTAPGKATPKSPRKKKRGSKIKRPRSTSPVRLGDITLLPHPSADAILVMADDDDVARVRRYVEMFDVKDEVETRFELQYVDANEAVATITQLLSTGGIKGSPVDFELFPLPTGSGFWYRGSGKHLKKVEEIIEVIDRAEEVVQLYIRRLKNVSPSFVASILSAKESGAGARAVSAKARKKVRKKPRPSRASTAGKFTPDDEQSRLFILCTQREWEGYTLLIDQLEAEAGSGEFVLLPVEHITPDEAIDKLAAMLNETQVTKIRFETTGKSIMVTGASETDLDTIRTLLAEFDLEVEIIERTFEIHYADPAELASVVETLVVEDSPGKKKRGLSKVRSPRKGKGKGGPAVRSVGPDLTIVQLDKFLIVRTTPEKMDRVAELIDKFDVKKEERTIRVYEDFPPGADLDWLSDTLSSLSASGRTGGTKLKPKSRAATGEAAPKFIPQPASGKLVVIAKVEQFEEIEKLLDVLREESKEEPIVVEYIEVHHADPVGLVEAIEPLLDLQIQQMIDLGELAGTGAKAPASRPTAKIGKKRKTARTAGRAGQRYHLNADERQHRIVIAGPQKIIDAAVKLIADFDQPGDERQALVITFVPVEHADPAELVDVVEPLLSMKVGEMIESGDLTETTGKTPAAAKGVKGAKRKLASAARKRGQDQRFHLAPDERNRRIVVAAPQLVVDEAIRLIEEFDRPGGDKPTFRTVELENSDADEMVQAIKEMLGAPVRRVSSKIRKKGAASGAKLAGTRLTVTAAPGGGALILRGPLEDVDQATEWIHHLDSMSVGGRLIKVYEIQQADIKWLVDFIMYSVDTPVRAAKPGKKKRGVPQRRPQESEPEDEFTTTITRSGADVYIKADLIDKTMVVSAPPAKIARIDDIVAQFESEEQAKVFETKAIPKLFYELKYKDAFDASFDLEMVFEALWDPSNQLPKVDYLTIGDGEVLVVTYPDRDRFPEIEALIAKYIDKPDEDYFRTIQKPIPVPSGVPAEFVARWIQMNHPELDVEVIDSSTTEDETYGVTQLQPLKAETLVNPCTLPLAFQRMVDGILMSAADQVDPDEPEVVTEDGEAERDADETDGPEFNDVETEPGRGSEAVDVPPNVAVFLKEQDGEPAIRKNVPKGEKLKVYYNNETGNLIIEGESGVLENAEDWMEDLKKELEITKQPPDIRIYQVRHIDVYQAVEIINEMYNATRQQRQMMQQQQRRLAQQQARQRQQQIRQQKQQQQKADQPGPQRRGAQQRGQQPQQQQQMAMLPADSVRIFPNPRDRTLIIRADTSQFPAILKLLATIDRPQPIENEYRVFQLKKLNAVEVEELLKTWLGLDQAQARSRSPRTTQPTRAGQRGRRTPQPASRSASAAGSRLPQALMQDTSTAGQLGVDPRDIKISSNEQTNTILAMAPKVALDYIEKVINDLEGQQIAERIWRQYKLEYADVEEVVEYLTSRFGEGGSTTRRAGARKGGRGAASRPSSPSTTSPLNTATFLAYPAQSILSAQATEEQMQEIDELIAQLDVPNVDEEWTPVKLAHADAGFVADTLTAMFGSGGGGRKARSPRGGRAPSGGSAGPNFVGEQGTKILFFSAPQRLHARVYEAINELEGQFQGVDKVRTIQLQHAKPSTVAEAIQEAYSGRRSSSKGRGGRGRGGGSSGASSSFTVTPDDASKRLFVMADDAKFSEIESLAKALDVEQKIGFDFKIYKLQYASARAIYDTLDKLVTDYLKRSGRGTEIEPFAVEVDENANALIVLGGPIVFGFVENALKSVDVPGSAPSPEGVLMVALKNADAGEVAQNINRLWGQKKDRSLGEIPPQAEANRALNTLIVRGTQAQLDEIKKDFLDPLEDQTGPILQTETITLEYAQAEDVADVITKIFEDKLAAAQKTKQPSTFEAIVAVTPNVYTNQVIVQASASNLIFIKDQIAKLDREEVVNRTATTTKIYSPKVADPNAVVNVLREWSRTKQQSAGRNRTVAPSEVIVAVAEPATQSVVVTASEENHLLIKEVIDGLDNEDVTARQRKSHVIALKNTAASDVTNQLTQVFRNLTRRRGDQGPAFVPDVAGNSVVASVNEEELVEVRQLIAALDQEPASDAQTVTRVYPLKHADPGSLNSVVTNMFRSARAGAQGNPAEQVIAAPETATQSLIVTASPKNHEVVAAMIQTVDKESAFTKTLHTYKLQKANAEDVGLALQEVYRGRRPSRRGDQPVQITFDAATNSLLIVANQAEMTELEELIKSLDVEPDSDRQRQIKAISLAYAEPSSVQDAINQLFRASGRNPRDQVTAVPEWGSRSVVVSASPENMKRIEELIGELDSEDANQQQVHVVALENSDAESVSQTLNEIFVRSAPRQQGNQGAPITISALQGSKAIVVKCTEDDYARIEAAVAELDKETAVVGEEVRIVTLLYSDATESKEAVQEYLRKPGSASRRGGEELVGDLRMAVLLQTNAVVISGDKARVDHVETLLREMDIAGEKGTVPQIIPLEFVNVSRILPSLEEMFEQGGRRGGGRGASQAPPVIVAEENSNTLIVRGRPTDVRAIEDIVEQLDTKERGDQPNFRLIKVATGISVEDLAEKIEVNINEGVAAQQGGGGGGRGRGRVPSITVTPDRRTNSLIVSGSFSLFDDAEDLVKAMEEMGPAGGSQVRILKIVGTPTEEVIRLIEQLKGEDTGKSKRGSSRRSSGGSRGGSSRRR